MTAQPPVFTSYDEDRKRIRAVLIVVVLTLATLFLFQAMDGIQQAGEQAERREQHVRMQMWRDGMIRQTMYPVLDAGDDLSGDTGTTGTAVSDPVH